MFLLLLLLLTDAYGNMDNGTLSGVVATICLCRVRKAFVPARIASPVDVILLDGDRRAGETDTERTVLLLDCAVFEFLLCEIGTALDTVLISRLEPVGWSVD